MSAHSFDSTENAKRQPCRVYEFWTHQYYFYLHSIPFGENVWCAKKHVWGGYCKQRCWTMSPASYSSAILISIRIDGFETSRVCRRFFLLSVTLIHGRDASGFRFRLGRLDDGRNFDAYGRVITIFQASGLHCDYTRLRRILGSTLSTAAATVTAWYE